MQKLARVGIVGWVRPVMPQRSDKLLRSPPVNLRRRRQPVLVNIQDRRVRRAQFVEVVEAPGVNLLRQPEAPASRLRQPYDLFQPCRARRLHMNPRIKPFQRAPNGAVNGKFVAARMHAQLQARRQSVLANRKTR